MHTGAQSLQATYRSGLSVSGLNVHWAPMCVRCEMVQWVLGYMYAFLRHDATVKGLANHLAH